jgi:hypothetical protein
MYGTIQKTVSLSGTKMSICQGTTSALKDAMKLPSALHRIN